MTDAPERIWAWAGRDNVRRWHSAPTSRDCAEYTRADLCADPALLAEAVEKLNALEKAASEVSRRGAETGPQWTKLTIALLSARAFIAKWENRQ